MSPSVSTPAAKPARLAQAATTGTRQALVLFARFKGEQTALPAWAGDIFNPELPGSIAHFYDTMSFGKLQVRGEVGPRVYESSQPASAYLSDDPSEQGRFGAFSQEILRQADQDLDFSRFDNDGPDGIPNSGDDDGVVDVVFLVLGTVPARFLRGPATGMGQLGFEEDKATQDPAVSGRPIRISPSQGTVQQGRTFAGAVGAMAHEYGHVLGLIDLYDADFLGQPGAPPEEDRAGAGAWDLMGWGALGWHGDDGPNSLSAWSRERLGWCAVVEITQADQEIRLAPVGSGGHLLRVPLTGREYFLLEYRTRTGTYYDRNLPGEGLLVWYVERTLAAGDVIPRWVVDLECADGNWRDAGYPLGRQPDAQAGGDNLDFWAHDTTYAQVHAGNLGDATDPFDGVRFTAFTPQTNPASYNLAGTLSARIEGIHREGKVMVAQVQTAPLVVEVLGLSIKDEDGDGFALAGEQLRVIFTLANTGGVAAQQVKALLRSDDPWVEILQGESHFQDLKLGRSSFGTPAKDFPRLRLRDGFVGVHRAALTLEIYAGETLVGQYDLEVNGVSPRQQVQRVAVIDSLGNGDGAVQGGEFIRLQVELAQVEDPAPLRYFSFSMRPLDAQVRLVGGAQVVFADTATKTGSSGEFLVPVGVAPGSPLQFELEVRSPFNTWRDTLAVEVAAGPDQTPPRVLGLQTRPVAGGVRLVLAANQVLEGGQVRRAEAVIYSRSDTSEVARVPLPWQDNHYAGVWTTSQADIYLVAAAVEDEAGNQGRSRLQGFAVRLDEGVEGPATTSAWEEIPLPHEGRRPVVRDLIRAPGNPEVLYASAGQGTWRSVDGGASWERLGVMRPASLSMSVLVDAVDPFLLYTTNWENLRSLKSRDGGMSWQVLAGKVYPLAADPVRYGRLFGVEATAQYGGLLISEDSGDTWSPTPVDTANFVEVNPGYPQHLYSGRLSAYDPVTYQTLPGTLWRSADGGRTWEKHRLDRALDFVKADPRSEKGLYAAGRNTIWHSEDSGSTWEQIHTLGTSYYTPPLTIHPADPQQLFVTSYSNENFVWRSRDAGATWEKMVVPSPVSSLVFHPYDPDQYYAVMYNYRPEGSLFHSTDAGGHWEEAPLPETSSIIGTVIFDGRGQIYAGSSRIQVAKEGGNILPGFYFSPEPGQGWVWRGETWTRDFVYWNSSDPLPIDVLYVDAQQPQLLFAHLRSEFLRSTDGGRNWKSIEGVYDGSGLFYPAIVPDPRNPGVYYLAGQGVWRSADFGETWEDRRASLLTQCNGCWSIFLSGLVLAMQAGQAVLYASVFDEDGLWRSIDEGRHWEFGGKVREGEMISALAINPLAADRIYALTSGGLYVSVDQGQTWTLLLSSEYEWWYMVRLRFDPGDPEHVFVVTGPELLETRDGGLHWRSLGKDLASVPWFNDVAVDPFAPYWIYAATPWGLFRLDTSKELTAVEEAGAVPQHFALHQNFPNPFNPTTTLRFTLPQAGEAELAIYDLLGQRVATLVKGVQEAGIHTLAWDGCDEQGRELASGVYLCRLQAGAQVEMRKLLLLR